MPNHGYELTFIDYLILIFILALITKYLNPALGQEKLIYSNTVKPVLKTTSEQRPPVNNDQIPSGPTKISSKFTPE